MDMNLAGKTVIVTGGGSNIGRGIALAFAREGSNVVIAELDEAQGQKVVKEANALGGRTVVIKTDVTDFDSVTAMVKKTLKEFGQLDILVNNVAWSRADPFYTKPRTEWDKEIDFVLRSVLNCVKAAIDHMVQRKYGKIINIASDAGRVGGAPWPIYSACKGGVIALSKALAQEFGAHSINVNVVSAGFIPAEGPEHIGKLSMWREGGEAAQFFTPEVSAITVATMPLQRAGRPADIANAVVFLASDAASYITGQTLSVSGGFVMI